LKVSNNDDVECVEYSGVKSLWTHCFHTAW
jgi:hypothetical protein